jgi:hypothetical protein
MLIRRADMSRVPLVINISRDINPERDGPLITEICEVDNDLNSALGVST